MQEPQSHIEDEMRSSVRIREEDIRKLQEAVSRYSASFYRRAYRYVGDEAEDVVQEALLSAYKHLDQFKGNAKMSTWLTSIVTNSALTQLRRKARRPQVSLDEPLAGEQDSFAGEILADSRPSPEDECIQSNLHGRLTEFVAELSPPLRQAVQLHHLDGLTTSETAQILGVPEGTVKARVFRARLKLKQRLSEARMGSAQLAPRPVQS
jgi:RNA polymerase sigma-70 factor (ECF subfamily)